MNQLILGDCLEVLKKLESESVDLIYLDPPFFSNRNYEVIWGDKGEVRSFEDRWSGGVEHYIGWLKERVEEMHRVLKPTGSIFLHCDWHAGSYIQVFILDKIFGIQNFRNQIVWKRTTTHNDAKQGAKQFGRVCDFIFFYSKNAKIAQFNTLYEEYRQEYILQTYNKKDTKGLFKASDLSAAKPGGNTSYEWKGIKPPKGRYWAFSIENMEEFERQDKIYYSSTGKPYLKHYLDEMPGVTVDDFWTNCIFKSKEERIGYPTQKPEALLERIIKCATNEEDVVLDPFNGGGTTVAVADKFNRQWIGIDSSVAAIKVTQFRLDKKQTDIFAKPFTVQLHKYDYDTLRYKDAFEFEKFIVQQFGGTSNTKQRGDLGLDGKTQDGIPIQVKRSDNIGRNVIDNFFSAVQRFDKNLFEKNKAENKPAGVIIAFSFGKGAIEEVARLKNQDGVMIQLLKVEDIIPIAKKPTLTLKFNDLGVDAKKLREIEFVATAESDAGIEFYAWDWDYENNVFKFDIVNDKIGKQTQKFKAGTHCIAVKVVDNDGLESIEVITLKINGDVFAI